MNRTLFVLSAAPILAFSPTAHAQEVAALPDQDRALGLERTEVYTIGGMEATDWDTFMRVESVAFDGTGNLHVFDSGARRLVVASPEGRHLRQLLRIGDGPGEVSSPMGFGVAPDGTVTVADMGRRALARFGADGAFLGSRTFNPGSDGIPGGALQAHPDGGFAFLQTGMMIERRPGQGLPSPPTTYPIRLIPGEDGPWSTVHEAWRPVREPSARPGPTSAAGPGGAGIRMAGQTGPRAFDPSPSFGVLPDGRLAVADTVTWRVKLVSPEGRVERILTRPFRPRAVTERDREAERARRAAEIEAGGGPQISMSVQGPSGPLAVDQSQIRDALLAQVRELEFAEEMPVLDRIATDWDGRIWVARRGERPGEPGPIDVLNARGGYIGTLPASRIGLPASFGPGGLVAFVERDEMDVPVIRVERIRLSLP